MSGNWSDAGTRWNMYHHTCNHIGIAHVQGGVDVGRPHPAALVSWGGKSGERLRPRRPDEGWELHPRGKDISLSLSCSSSTLGMSSALAAEAEWSPLADCCSMLVATRTGAGITLLGRASSMRSIAFHVASSAVTSLTPSTRCGPSLRAVISLWTESRWDQEGCAGTARR